MKAVLKCLLLFAPLFAMTACAGKSVSYSDVGNAPLPEFNQTVLEIIRQYPDDGTHDYWWPKANEPQYDGVSEDLYLDGQLVMSGEKLRRTYCCGLTLEVFLRAYNQWLAERPTLAANKPVKPEDWKEFQRLWFVEKLNGPGPSAALEKFNIGKEIPAAEVLPGDFVQLWRTKNDEGKTSGHSVIFLNWVSRKNRIVGIHYWSTQPGTDGIHENTEYFGPMGGLSTENTHYARVSLEPPAPVAGK